jgi:two-component system alkaline phosphatase synthesis response regulator PhoP
MMELLARIESLLRRPTSITLPSSSLTTYSFGPFTIDFRKMEIARKGKPVDLSAREFQLLRFFIEHRGSVLSRETILNSVWGIRCYAHHMDYRHTRNMVSSKT